MMHLLLLLLLPCRCRAFKAKAKISSVSGEGGVITGVGAGTTNINVNLGFKDNSYAYPGNTQVIIPITVFDGATVCSQIKCADGYSCNSNTGSCEPTAVPGVAVSMEIVADKTTIDCTVENGGLCTPSDIANLRVVYYDAFGAEILIPEATTDHSITWTSDDITIATVASAYLDAAKAGKKKASIVRISSHHHLGKMQLLPEWAMVRPLSMLI